MKKVRFARWFGAIALCLVLLLVFSGCGGNGETSDESESASESVSESASESVSESASESASESETEPDLTTPTAGLKIETGLFFFGLFRQDPVITGFETAEDVEYLVIPSHTSDGTPILGIGKGAFRNCKSLKVLVIPDGVKVIDADAFEGCTSLERVILPEGFQCIESNAFSNCTSLTSMAFPSTLTYCSNLAFEGCTAIEEFTVANGGNKDGYTSRDGILYLRNKAENGRDLVLYPSAKRDTELVIDDDVFSIHAVISNPYLEKVTFGKNLRRFDVLQQNSMGGSYVFFSAPYFRECPALKEITVPKVNPAYVSVDGVLYSKNPTHNLPKDLLRYPPMKEGSAFEPDFCRGDIREYAFYGCKLLESVTLEYSKIGAHAFENCENLKSVAFSANNPRLAGYAFNGCRSLKEVTVLAELELGGGYHFANCVALEEIVLPTTYLGAGTFYNCTSLRSVDFRGKLTEIGSFPFYGCTSLPSFTLPKEVRKVKGGLTAGCPQIASIEVEEGNLWFSAIDGILYSNTGYELIYFPEGRTDTTYVFPETVGEVAEHAFFGNKTLESVTLTAEDSDNAYTKDGVVYRGRYGMKDAILFYPPKSKVDNLTVVNSYGCAIRDAEYLTTLTITIDEPGELEYPPIFSNCPSLTTVNAPYATVEEWLRYEKFLDPIACAWVDMGITPYERTFTVVCADGILLPWDAEE